MKVIYENCQCLSLTDKHMFYCTKKKARSYLKKGLATLLSEEPFVFKLNFEPKGEGNPDQQPRENKCVVCGSENDLTRHHVVPYALRKMLPAELKDHLSEDIVPLCEEHHREYEVSSRALMNVLLENCKPEIEQRDLVRRAQKAKHNLEAHIDKLTDERIETNLALLPYVELPFKSDFQLLLEKNSERELYDMWRRDFLIWLSSKGITNFEFKK
jgi:hypothetical protein